MGKVHNFIRGILNVSSIMILLRLSLEPLPFLPPNYASSFFLTDNALSPISGFHMHLGVWEIHLIIATYRQPCSQRRETLLPSATFTINSSLTNDEIVAILNALISCRPCARSHSCCEVVCAIVTSCAGALHSSPLVHSVPRVLILGKRSYWWHGYNRGGTSYAAWNMPSRQTTF